MTTHPRILGVAGGSLNNATWAANASVAKVGKAGEQKTAQMLNRFAQPENGVTVLHDLRIPIPGFTANIDHVVVSGHTVHIIDSKVWKPARYWTLGTKTRRGWERFEPAEKKTMEMAYEAITRHLSTCPRAEVVEPVLVVWPSSPRVPLKVRMLRVPGARALTGEKFADYADKQFAASRAFGIGGGNGKPADPNIVFALASLLMSPPQQRRTGTDGW